MTEIDRVTKINESRCLAVVNWAVARLTEPEPPVSGTGCVMVAGGKYLRPAWAAVAKLRESWPHPIQIWHLGAAEVHGAPGKFARFGVEFVDAQEVRKKHHMNDLTGWTAKGFAVKHCPWQHVLLLDADSYVQRPIHKLFEWSHYRRTGLVLTPDIKKNRPNDNMFPLIGLKLPKEYTEAEAGQVLVDKLKCWKAVQLMNWINSNGPSFFYRLFHGDKESWPLAWMKLDMPFSMTPPCHWTGVGMQHFWFDSEKFTHHVCDPKRAGSRYPEEIHSLMQEYDTL